MSVFITHRSPIVGEQTRQIRSLHTSIGINAGGTLEIGEPHERYFTLSRIGERFILTVFTERARLNGQAVSPLQQMPLESEVLIQIEREEWVFLPTDAVSESLASADIGGNQLNALSPTASEQAWPIAEIRVAAYSVKVPLFPEVPIVFGSSDSAGVLLPFADVQSEHFALMAEGNTVTVLPRDGRVRYRGKEVLSTCVVEHGDGIELIPSGLTVHLHVIADAEETLTEEIL